MTFISILTSACTLLGIRTQETPQYEVLFKEGNKEIRHYAPYLVVTTVVSGSYKDAQREAFRRLADYIFGNNTKRQSISMTAPVTQSSNEKIAMTAPVTQTQTGKQWTMSFVIPKKYQLDTLPKPNNKAVKIQSIPSTYYGVITYSGYDSVKRNQQQSEGLLEWMKQFKTYRVSSQPIFAGYNPPWTISFLRKNEMRIKLKKIK